MRILLVGNSMEVDSVEVYAQRALESLGHTVIPFDCQHSRLKPIAALPLGWRAALRHVIPTPREWFPWLNRQEASATNRALLDFIAKERPDVLFVVRGTPLAPELLREVGTRFRIPRINWCTDDPFRYLSDAVYPHYDIFATTDPSLIEPLRQRGAARVLFLPFACDPAIHRRLELDETERRQWQSQLCFMGTYQPYRAMILEAVKDFDLAIWGWGWDRLPANSPLRRFVRGGGILAADWVKAYNAATLVLHITWHVQADGTWVALKPLVPMRPFEALGCGVPLLTSWNDTMAQFFHPGVDLDTYDTADELRQKVRYYLDHADEGRPMAQRGQALVYAHHTYLHRVQELLRVLEDVKVSR